MVNKPHKHAELIKAWADGATVQKQISEGKGTNWIDISKPVWHVEEVYRIKPEEKKPVVRWLWAHESNSGFFHSTIFFDEEEAKKRGFVIKLEWSRTEFPE